ncbi:Pre-mRNA-splicing factor slt11 [Cryoendolithus antarcticus]|uniref:Pre-mRNA-splicing factor slt11 n=1 Tax=Cryoendolithus antarcticus TaxID=1507870 RepID=A0A1V8SQX5_9PEZI|nr:Pre-mRNA-splicing factor slt11 [Cryoendolithus antarcticus]
MPPQIKQDLNRSGWETTDMPSVCERCLPDNPYVQMLKEDHGAACSLCTRPFSIFRWKADRTSRQKRTSICLTCARLKNCCQCCMLDLSFGLPITIRDAALKMVENGPRSSINREYFAQNREKDVEEGRGLEGYEKTGEKARELLSRLARTEPYYKKQRRLEAEGEREAEGEGGQKLLEGGGEEAVSTGPIRTSDNKKSTYGAAYAAGQSPAPRSGTATGIKRPFPSAAALPLKPADLLPPSDPHVTSLFVTGVEDDLPEHALRTFFSAFGALRSVVCSHRSHCAFMNYMERADAEKAMRECHGRAVVRGVPLRVQWGKPKPLDSLDRDTRMEHARAGRGVAPKAAQQKAIEHSEASAEVRQIEAADEMAAPPGEDEVVYPSMAGE